MLTTDGEARYGGYGEMTDDDFLARTGNATQKRHTRKGQFFDMAKAASENPLPPTPTTPSFSELDFKLDQANASTSSISLPRPHDSSTASSSGGDGHSLSPDSSPTAPFPTHALPSPHLPLRKSSASDLRAKALTNGHEYYRRESISPTRAVTDPLESYRSSPRTHRTRQPALSPTETSFRENISPREAEAYVNPAARIGRARGMTSASQNSPNLAGGQLRSASSIPDFRHSARNQVSSTYRPDRGPNSRDVSMHFRSPPPIPWKDNEEVRSSFRSALTNGSYVTYASSGILDASDTERNSIMTRASSVSDLHYKRISQSVEDEGMSVDDAIALYMNGFNDDELEKKLDQGIEDVENFFRSSLEDDKPLPQPVDVGPQTDEALPTATRYDSKFRDDFNIPKSPSAPDLPLSPLKAHPVRSPSPESAPTSPTDSTHPPLSPFDDRPKLFLDKPVPAEPLPESERFVQIEQFEPVPRDRYGFKKTSQYVTVDEYDAWNANYNEYLDRRRKKWVALMKQWGLATDSPIRFPPKSDKVKRYIRKGVPPDWRGAAWFWYAGGPSKIAQNPGLYRQLVIDAENGLLSAIDRECIERDLNRTFPDNIKFKPDPTPEPTQDFPGRNVRPPRSDSKPEVPIIKALRRVLQAFSIHNPNIGYCQSLNFLAGLLLIFLDEDEEKAFHLLEIITTTHLPGTHAKILEANVDVGVLMSCIKESMPAVWAKIDDIDHGRGRISTNRLPTVSLATTAWFMSCFVGNLPMESVLRVWDSFFYEGSKTLFRIALAIFKSGEWEIRNVSEHMEVFQIVQAIPRRLLDANSLMESCYKRRNGFGHLSQETIDARRKERRTAMQAERDRKNGQLNPLVSVPNEDLRPPTRDSRLRRAASKAVKQRGKSKTRAAKPVDAI